MTLKQKRPAIRKLIIILLAILVVATAAATMFIVLRNLNTSHEPKSAPSGEFVFSFDSAKAPGWYRSAMDPTTTESRNSILLFDHDPSAPFDAKHPQSCHVSAFMQPGTVDIAAKLSKIEAKNDSTTTSRTGTQPMTLQTSVGAKSYELYQYKTTPAEGAEPLKEGYAYGFVQADKHFIELQAVCDTAEQLASTIPAFQAITFDETKADETTQR